MKVEWERVKDGEYNEVKATVNGVEIHVSSDRDGDSWDYTINDGEMVSGYGTKWEAQEAAVAEAMSK